MGEYSALQQQAALAPVDFLRFAGLLTQLCFSVAVLLQRGLVHGCLPRRQRAFVG
jgi:hypothetical protein